MAVLLKSVALTLLSLTTLVIAQRNAEDQWKYRGVNIGGVFVLEPWITPSLFYQFEGKKPRETAIDSYRFCEVLGGQEANRQLQQHWDTFVTEENIIELASYGINALRLPVADWMYVPYYPFTNGCWNGADSFVDRIIQWAANHDMVVFLDLHAAIGGQNGFDNGGKAREIIWKGMGEYEKRLNPGWMINLDESQPVAGEYINNYDFSQEINYRNLNQTTKALEIMAQRYFTYSNVAGVLDVINEPLWTTPLEYLKRWYEDTAHVILAVAPHWKLGFHDSFRLDKWESEYKLDLPRENAFYDTHIYQAWKPPQKLWEAELEVCQNVRNQLRKFTNNNNRVVVGEWSTATDACTLWLNGWNAPRPTGDFMDQCGARFCGPCNARVPEVDVPGENGLSIAGNGPTQLCQCPITADARDDVVKDLTLRMLDVYASETDGWFFWNFKTENTDPRWGYLDAVRRGILPKNLSEAIGACDRDCGPGVHCEEFIALYHIAKDNGNNDNKPLKEAASVQR